VVTLALLMPALLPNCAKPSLKSICGGTVWLTTPAICGSVPAASADTVP
jgi:hypothetical protein